MSYKSSYQVHNPELDDHSSFLSGGTDKSDQSVIRSPSYSNSLSNGLISRSKFEVDDWTERPESEYDFEGHDNNKNEHRRSDDRPPYNSYESRYSQQNESRPEYNNDHQRSAPASRPNDKQMKAESKPFVPPTDRNVPKTLSNTEPKSLAPPTLPAGLANKPAGSLTKVASNEVRRNDDCVFLVAFKRNFRDYILGVRVATVIAVGDAVIVTAERGEDLGMVNRILTRNEYMMERFGTTDLPTFNINKLVGRVLRAATAREVRTLGMKLHDENEVLKYCDHLVYNVYRMDMKVVDAEYQFDRHKLSIYYYSNARLDFRDFVHDIFTTFNARVFMELLPYPTRGGDAYPPPSRPADRADRADPLY